MRIIDLIKMSQIEQFNIINSNGLPIGIIKKNDTDESNELYATYKNRLVKVISIPTTQNAISTLNVEIKVDRKKKQAVEEMKAILGPNTLTNNIKDVPTGDTKIQEPAVKKE